jgi:hypothetical protein
MPLDAIPGALQLSRLAEGLVVPDPPAKVPAAVRWLWIAEAAALVMSLLTLFGCALALFIFLFTSLARGGVVESAEPAGPKPDYSRVTAYETEQFARQRAKAELRAAVYEMCALLVGVAVAFFGLKLLLAAARAWGEEPGRGRTAWECLAPMVPGLVALVCATLIVATAREVSPAAGPEPDRPRAGAFTTQ